MNGFEMDFASVLNCCNLCTYYCHGLSLPVYRCPRGYFKANKYCTWLSKPRKSGTLAHRSACFSDGYIGTDFKSAPVLSR